MEHEDVGGHKVPVLGLGTLGNQGDAGTTLVEAALAEGYRYIDTGRYYGNEDAVGRALSRSSVPRDEIWLTTKLLHPRSGPMPDLPTALDESLRMLQTDYVDQLLIHWPNPDVPLSWALEHYGAFRDAGKVRTIGVSNFPTALVREALDLVADLVTDQVEYHPYLAQDRLLDLLRQRGLVLTAHSPLLRGEILTDPVVTSIAGDRGVTPAQVALRWVVQQARVVAIPGARTVEQLRDNLGALDFALDQAEMQAVSGLARGRRIVDPPHGPQWDAD